MVDFNTSLQKKSCQSGTSFNTFNLELLYTSAADEWCLVSSGGAGHLQKALGVIWALSGESMGAIPHPL